MGERKHATTHNRLSFINTSGGQKNDEDLHGMLFDYKIISEEMDRIGFKNVQRYNWKEFEAFSNEGYDDFSAAYLPHMDFENGRLMMLNINLNLFQSYQLTPPPI